MSSDEGSMSDDDLEIENVEEAANVRVVQSSMHASIVNSLFRVTENKKESDNDSESEENRDGIVKGSGLEAKIEEKIQTMPIIISNIEEFSVKIEEKIEIPPESLENLKNERKSTQKSKKESFSQALQEIFSDKKRPQPRNSDLEKRFFEYNEKRNQKIETLKELKKAEESILCTFKPQTLNKQDPKNFSHFLGHMQLVDKLKKEKLEKNLLEKEENEKLDPKSFKPTLSKGTQKIVKKHKSLGNLHEKLYKESSELRKKKEIDSKAIIDGICSFRPTVSSMSLALKREGQISERLYLESKNKKKSNLTPEKKIEKLISDESENIIREKFLKEIDQILLSSKDNPENPEKLENSENPENPEKFENLENLENPEFLLEYNDFLSLLKNLNFVQSKPGSSNFDYHHELTQKM